MARMSDDEISELAEALENACRAFERMGGCITSAHMTFGRCPIEALLRRIGDPHPSGDVAAKLLKIDPGAAWSFMAGFDGDRTYRNEPDSDRRLFQLGRLFREQYDPDRHQPSKQHARTAAKRKAKGGGAPA